MAGTGPSTEKIEFDTVGGTHGRPVTLKDELPGYSGVGSAPPTDQHPHVTRTERVETRVSKRASDGDDGDSELRQKLLVAGALVAAGVAIVFGVRHFRGEEQPEETKNWLQRKAKDVKHDTKHAAKEAKHEAKHAAKEAEDHHAGDGGHGLLDSASDAVHKVGSKAHDAYETVVDKLQVDDLRHEAKEKVEAETKAANKRAASPATELEQRRMTYGEDKHGVPKGLDKDAGFLGYKNWFPGANKR